MDEWRVVTEGKYAYLVNPNGTIVEESEARPYLDHKAEKLNRSRAREARKAAVEEKVRKGEL